MDEVKKIALLGSTGSIGTQALEVIDSHADKFQVEVLTAHSNHALLLEQARKFKPNAVVIGDESHYSYLSDELWPLGIKVYAGEEALAQVVEMDDVDLVLTALVGFAGLRPTMHAIRAGKHIALANKYQDVGEKQGVLISSSTYGLQPGQYLLELGIRQGDVLDTLKIHPDHTQAFPVQLERVS